MTSRRARVLLALGTLACFALAALVGVRVTYVAYDEGLYGLSAANISREFPFGVLSDPFSRATTRLYALLMAPAFGLFGGDVALRVDRVLTAALFCSASIPAALLARTVLRDRRAIVAAGLLAVATPWLVMATSFYAEAVAYPAFLWLLMAAVRAARAPGWRTELLVLVAFVVVALARLQLAFAFGGWVVVVVACVVLDVRDADDRRGWPRRLVRLFPLTMALGALVVLAALLVAVSGAVRARLSAGLDAYGPSLFRDVLPVDPGLAALVQVELIGLGVGLLSGVVALAWYVRALGARREQPAAFAFALATACLSWSLLVLTIGAQNGFVGPIVEERYYFYAAPLAWIAAFAALERRPAVRRADLLAAGLPLVVVLMALAPPRGLDQTTTFLAPVSAHANRLVTMAVGEVRQVTGISFLSVSDVLWPLGALGLLALWLTWPRPRAAARVLGAAVLVQLALTLYPLGTSAGLLGGGLGDRTGGPSVAARGWVDRAAGSRSVRWLSADPRADAAQVNQQRLETPFFNDRIVGRLALAGLPEAINGAPMDAFPTALADAAADGALRGIPPGLTLQWRDSPLGQVGGRVLARSPDGVLELRDDGGRAQYAASGLSVEGLLLADSTAAVRAWVPGGGDGRLVLTLAPPAGAGGQRGIVDVGGRTTTLPAGTIAREQLLVPLCDGGQGAARLRGVEGVAQADGRTVAAVVVAARVEHSACP